MTWEPPAAIDAEIRRWMKSHGLEVSRTEYDFNREVYGWREDRAGEQSPMLRIAQSVLESFNPEELVRWLNRLKVADVMREHPHMVVRLKGEGIVLDTLTGAPRKPPRRKNY